MPSAYSKTKFMTRGRYRHSYLQNVLKKVKYIGDLKKTFVCCISSFLKDVFPNISDSQRIFIKSEVPILNRRPDFILYIPNIALILLEYKTSNSSLKIKPEYLKQVRDTFTNFYITYCLKSYSQQSKIKLLSLLLIRNSSNKQNKLVCVKQQDIENKPFQFN